MYVFRPNNGFFEIFLEVDLGLIKKIGYPNIVRESAIDGHKLANANEYT